MNVRLTTAIVLLLGSVLAAPAHAVSARDIIELSRAGLGDDVLLALIEVDGTVFTMDAALIRSLKENGVSERVIEAMIRSGRSRAVYEPPAPPVEAPELPPPPAPVVIVERIVERREEPRRIIVPVPVYVTAPVARTSARQAVRTVYVPRTAFGVVASLQPEPKPSEPVYWGWGGKLRPDAWKPAGYQDETPAKPEKGNGGVKRH